MAAEAGGVLQSFRPTGETAAAAAGSFSVKSTVAVAVQVPGAFFLSVSIRTRSGLRSRRRSSGDRSVS